MKTIKNRKCKHENSFFFHENAPQYCPECDNYIDGGKKLIKKQNRNN